MTKPFSRMLVTAALAPVLLAAPASGQQAAAPPQQQTTKQPAPVLRATSRLVELNVVVHDKKGNPITGLTRDDFVVKDEGQPQQISVFLEQTEQSSPTAPAPLPSNSFSNLRELRSGPSASFTVILLDALNTHFDDRASVRNQIIKFLRQIRPADRVAIYVLGREIHVLYDFSNDASALVEALAHYKGAMLSTPDVRDSQANSRFGALDFLFEESHESMAEEITEGRILQTVRAFEVIADHLAGLPGRKNVIWVSEAFPSFLGFHGFTPGEPLPTQLQSYSEELERAVRALNKANLAVYPVGAVGLIAPSVGVEDSPDDISALYPSSPEPPDSATLDTMKVLAERTGGMAFYNTNDIKGSIRRAIDDSRVNYLLGYYPQNVPWNGKFRTVRVEVKRPDVEARTRGGYFALPDKAADTQERQIEALKGAVGPLDATAIALSATVEHKEGAGARTISFLLQLDPHPLRFEEKGGHWVGGIDFSFVQRKANGEVVKVAGQTANLRMLPETYAEVMRKGLRVSKDLDLEASASELRIIVRDATSDALGSLTIPLASLIPPDSKPANNKQ